MSNCELRINLLGGVRVTRGGESQRLTPFQAALIALVFTHGEISRPSIARHLWVGEFDSRARHRLRQLLSATRKRLGVDLFNIEGDLVRKSAHIASDACDVRAAISASRLEQGARLLLNGSLAPDLEGLPDAFDDWRESAWVSWRRSISEASQAAWLVHSQAGEWAQARDAAEAMVAFDASDEMWVGRLIEARGRNGQTRAAEVAYANYCSRLTPREQPDEDIVAVIEAVRELPGSTDTRNPRPPKFVGRHQAIEAMHPLFTDVRKGRPRLAIISGEAGIGKTRLLHELRRSAHLDGFRCLHARSVEFERIIALSPLIDALRTIDVEPHLSSLGEPWRTVVGAVLPPGSLASPIGGLPLIQEENLPRRLFDAFSLLFEAIAREQPTILFLDDLHWADSTTVSALQFFQRRSTATPFGVIASVRPDAVRQNDPCRTLLADDAEIVTHRVRLGDIAESEARELVCDVMGDMANKKNVDAVIKTAGCHPLYLIEIARNRAEARRSALGPFTPGASVSISLKKILLSRTRDLSDEARNMCDLMAVGAGRMTLGDLSDLTGNSIDRVVQLSEELQAARIANGDRDRIWIAHELFQSAIYNDLSEPRRAVLHRRIALFMCDRDDPPVDQLATHLDRAGDTETAATYGWLAGERCLARGAVAEAAHFYELTARNEREPERIAEALSRQGVAHHLGRDMARATPVLELASLRLRAVGEDRRARRLDIRKAEALAEADGAVTSDLLARLRAIKDEARGQEDWEAVALALDGELKACLLNEQFDRVRSITHELRSLEDLGTDCAKVATYSALSVALILESTEAAERAASVALAHASPNDWSRIVALNRLLMVMVHRGRMFSSKAVELLKEADSLVEASGDLQQKFSLESNRALGYMDAGLLDSAKDGFDRAEQVIGTATMTFARANLACNRGTLAVLQGHIDEAVDHFRLASQIDGPEAPRYVSDAVNAGLGLCALGRGAVSEALRRESALRGEPKIWYYDPSLTMEFRSQLLYRRGEGSAAIKLLERGAEAVEGRFISGWLKLKLSQATLMARIGHSGLNRVATLGMEVATASHMPMRIQQFERLLNPRTQ